MADKLAEEDFVGLYTYKEFRDCLSHITGPIDASGHLGKQLARKSVIRI